MYPRNRFFSFSNPLAANEVAKESPLQILTMTHDARSRRQGRYHLFYRRVIFTLGVGEPSWSFAMYYLCRACARPRVRIYTYTDTYVNEAIARNRVSRA